MSRFGNELDWYLWNNDAGKEERKCVRLWVKDGHWINENDHNRPEGIDFLSASREAEYYCSEYTDSFYDPKTQEYIRRMKPTLSEMRKLRKHIRSGGRFCDDFHTGCTAVDYITYLRTKEEYKAAEFESAFGEWIAEYGAEYLSKTGQESKFIEFLETKTDYSSKR